MSMTWKELREMIDEMPEERRQDSATVHDAIAGEIHMVNDFGVIEDMDQQGDIADSVLDKGHFVLKFY